MFAESIYKDGDLLRNGTVTTIAPTGTLSMIGGCSSGVEPVFAYVYIRNIMDGTEMLEVNPVLREKLQERGLYSDALMRKSPKKVPSPISRRFPRTSAVCLFVPTT